MDFETLISEVTLHPELWDTKNKYYSNRIRTDKLWEDVAKKLNCSKEKCKKKWKYLKDEYRKAVKKEPKLSSGSASAPFKSSFRYYELLSFLKDHVVRRASKRNLADGNEVALSAISETEDQSEKGLKREAGEKEELESHQKLQNVDKSVNQEIVKRKKEHKDSSLELEKKITKLMEIDETASKHENCEDMHFFKSLLPYMKTLGPVQRLQARTDIQNVVLKYVQDLRSS